MRTFLVLCVLLLCECLCVCVAVIPSHLRIDHLDSSTHGDDLVVNSVFPSFSWRLEEESSQAITQLAYQLQIHQQDSSGVYLLSDAGDSGKVPSSASTFVTAPVALKPNSRYEVHVRYWSSSGEISEWATARFRTAMFDGWREIPAQWIGSNTLPVHQLKKEFVLPAPASMVSATIQMSGIGYSNLFVNGRKADPSRVNDPGWTTYQRRTLYINLAVEDMLTEGQSSAVAVELGNGWYSQEQYISGQQQPTYGPPRLWFWLHVYYADGSTFDVYSDTTWIGSGGPIIHDGVYMGSIFDARLERTNWTVPGFYDPLVLWIPLQVLPSPLDDTGIFALQIQDPIRYPPNNLHVFTSHKPAASPSGLLGVDLVDSYGGVIQPVDLGGHSEGQILDLQQNIAGWCSFGLVGKRGISVLVRYTETMTYPHNPQNDNSLYSENLRNAASTDIFVFSMDDQLEFFEPRFTQHGFRYIEFRGLKNQVDVNNVKCYFIHSETNLVGSFNSSSAVMNQIQHNVQWSQLSNMMSLPTDCPQRDERKGWMGDAGLSVDESLYNFDSAAFYINFLNLIKDVQVDGAVPDTVPLAFGSSRGDPNWQTAYPTILWTMYEHYGDVNLVSQFYESCKAMVEATKTGWAQTGLANMYVEYGDWVPPSPAQQTNRSLTSSFPFLRDVLTVSKMAQLLNDTETYAEYSAFYTQLATEFHGTFYTNDSTGYSDGMQTANALALALPGVVPDKLVATVLAALVNDVKSRGHLTTGIVGVAQLFPVLSANGNHDLALMLAQSTSYPSYGYMFTNDAENATTLWELWDSPFEGPGMNSRNHIMFGSIGAWFYRDVAGIRLNGLESITIRPRMAMDKELMPEMHAEVVTIKGSITVDYQRSVSEAGMQRLSMQVRIPPNAAAVVQLEPMLQGGRCQRLVESGRTLWPKSSERFSVAEFRGVSSVAEDANGLMSVAVASGVYDFVAEWN